MKLRATATPSRRQTGGNKKIRAFREALFEKRGFSATFLALVAS
jgi:hypothetical protein